MYNCFSNIELLNSYCILLRLTQSYYLLQSYCVRCAQEGGSIKSSRAIKSGHRSTCIEPWRGVERGGGVLPEQPRRFCLPLNHSWHGWSVLTGIVVGTNLNHGAATIESVHVEQSHERDEYAAG